VLSNEDKEYVRKNCQTVTVAEMSKTLGCRYDTLFHWIKRNNLTIKLLDQVICDKTASKIRFLAKTHTISQISKLLTLKKDTLRAWGIRNSVSFVIISLAGKKQLGLTLIKEGKSIRAAAKIVGISPPLLKRWMISENVQKIEKQKKSVKKRYPKKLPLGLIATLLEYKEGRKFFYCHRLVAKEYKIGWRLVKREADKLDLKPYFLADGHQSIAQDLKELSLEDIAIKNNCAVGSLRNYCVANDLISKKCLSQVQSDINRYVCLMTNTEVFTNDRKTLTNFKDVNSRNKELDIYIPSIQLAIEVDGAYWHSRNRRPDDKLNILNKHLLAKQHGIRTIHLYDLEWNNQKSACKNILKAAICSVDLRIGARKCQIRPVNPSNQREFLEEYHIQGYIPSKFCLGLYYQEELFGLMSVGKARFGSKADFELYRLCYKTGIKIVGGSVRLWKNLLKLIPSGATTISYSDRRLFTGDVYIALGFTHIGYTSPDYFYSKSGLKKENRMKFQKHKLKQLLEVYDPTLSEFDNMSNNGWCQTWGTGNHIFEYTKA
jgi:phage antirepressor YoqD-like protein